MASRQRHLGELGSKSMHRTTNCAAIVRVLGTSDSSRGEMVEAQDNARRVFECTGFLGLPFG